MMKRLRFRLSTLLLLMACIAAGFATWNKRHAWYVSRTVPSGFQNTCKLAAFEEQDLLVCLKSSIPERMVLRRLSTGEVLHDFDADPLRVSYLQAGQQGQLYGFRWHRLTRIDPTKETSTELMTTPSVPPESEQIVAVSPDGRSVLIAANEVIDFPGGGRGKLSSATVTYRVRDVASGDLLWELPTTETSNSMGAFSADGQRIGVDIGSRFQVWDYRKNLQIYDSPLSLNTMLPPIFFPDGRRVFGRYAIWDLRSGAELGRVDFGSHYAAIVNDSFLVADDDGRLRYWRRRRMEGSWSPLSFPEPWITSVLAIVCMCDVVRHSRRRR
jgi:WD40 repeat protein